MDLMETHALVMGAVLLVHLILVATVAASTVVALACFGIVVTGVQAVNRGRSLTPGCRRTAGCAHPHVR